MVRKGYSSMSKLSVFIEGRKMAPPPLPMLAAADVFREPPESYDEIKRIL